MIKVLKTIKDVKIIVCRKDILHESDDYIVVSDLSKVQSFITYEEITEITGEFSQPYPAPKKYPA